MTKLLFILLLLLVGCNSPTESETLCNEEIEVELWGKCYNIENTIILAPSILQTSGQSIPPEIGNLTNLIWLFLHEKQLIGEIPSEIGNLINLGYMFLWNNNLTGEIPSSIRNLTNLIQLNLSNNQLTGEIPPEIENLTNLIGFSLSNNQLTEEIPSEIGNLINLNYLVLSDNQLTGEIPSEICNQGASSPQLEENQLCPPYPECLSEYGIGYQDTTNCND